MPAPSLPRWESVVLVFVSHYYLDGTLAVNLPAYFEGTTAPFGYRREAGLVRFEIPYRGREGWVFQRLGDSREYRRRRGW